MPDEPMRDQTNPAEERVEAPEQEASSVQKQPDPQANAVQAAPAPGSGTGRRQAALLLALVGVALVGYSLWKMQPPAPPAPPSSSVQEEEPVSDPGLPALTLALPEPEFDQPELVGKLFITGERQAYQSGQMTLRVPRLGVVSPVQSSTTDADLAVGVGLFDYAQLPGEGNRNVSLAGHRDVKGCEFYYIDRLTPGDLFYLTYNGTVYTYQYKETTVIEANDWSRIAGQGYSCITLLSCHPLGTTRQRIVVVGQLVRTEPETEGYVYAPTIPGLEKPGAWEDGAITWEEALAQAGETADSQADAPAVEAPEGEELPLS